jgi:hypothetical protein
VVLNRLLIDLSFPGKHVVNRLVLRSRLLVIRIIARNFTKNRGNRKNFIRGFVVEKERANFFIIIDSPSSGCHART